jgi:hypothetical protein
MIATLDRLMTLARKLQDAERSSERDPIYVALDVNEVHLLSRMLEDYLGDMDSFSASADISENRHSDDGY